MRRYDTQEGKEFTLHGVWSDSLPYEVKKWILEQNISLPYRLDNVSQLSEQEIQKNIEHCKKTGERISIQDVGERSLSAEEVAYNRDVGEKQRKENLEAQREWENTTDDGRLLKVVTQAHYHALDKKYGSHNRSGASKAVYENSIYKISNGDDGGLYLHHYLYKKPISELLDTEKRHPFKQFSYEFGPPGKWIGQVLIVKSRERQKVSIQYDELIEVLQGLEFKAN